MWPLHPGGLALVPELFHVDLFSLHGTLAILRVLDLLLLLLRLRQVHALSAELGKELADPLLVDLVFRVLARAEQLSQPSASLEQDQVSECTGKRPVDVGLGLQAAPLVQAYPEGLFGCEVRVARPAEKTSSVEATV